MLKLIQNLKHNKIQYVQCINLWHNVQYQSWHSKNEKTFLIALAKPLVECNISVAWSNKRNSITIHKVWHSDAPSSLNSLKILTLCSGLYYYWYMSLKPIVITSLAITQTNINLWYWIESLASKVIYIIHITKKY